MSTASGSSGTSGSSGSSGDEAPRKAGAFDIRVFIASLIGIYGVVLVIYGIVGGTAADMEKTGDVNINLWAGIGMVLVAAFFIIWARLRPVVVPAHVEDSGEAPRGH
jgi:hypothetical protein